MIECTHGLSGQAESKVALTHNDHLPEKWEVFPLSLIKKSPMHQNFSESAAAPHQTRAYPWGRGGASAANWATRFAVRSELMLPIQEERFLPWVGGWGRAAACPTLLGCLRYNLLSGHIFSIKSERITNPA